MASENNSFWRVYMDRCIMCLFYIDQHKPLNENKVNSLTIISSKLCNTIEI